MVSRSVIAFLVLAVLVTIACSADFPTPPTDLVVDGGAPWVTAVWIESEHISEQVLEMKRGDETQLTACAYHSDDYPNEDCTIEAQWMSSDPAVLVVDGLVRAVAAGRAVVEAEYHGESSPGVLVKVRVGGDLPVWTLSGSVSNSETGRLILSATVRVRDGLFAGVSDRTDRGGRYRLFDIAGRLRIDAEAEGYESETATIEMTRDRVHHFNLAPRHAGATAAGPDGWAPPDR